MCGGIERSKKGDEVFIDEDPPPTDLRAWQDTSLGALAKLFRMQL